MRINHHKLIREARQLINRLPEDSATRADLSLIVLAWEDGGEDAVEAQELLVAVMDGREELRQREAA